MNNLNLPTQDSGITSGADFGDSAQGLSKTVGNTTDAVDSAGSKIEDGASTAASAVKNADMLFLYYQALYFLRLLGPYIVALLIGLCVFALYKFSQ